MFYEYNNFQSQKQIFYFFKDCMPVLRAEVITVLAIASEL